MAARKLFQIFRAGQHTAMSGAVLNFSDQDIAMMVAAYNGAFRKPAPLVLGHPGHPAETFGEVERLSSVKGALFAVAKVADPLVCWVRQGLYKKVSASFFDPASLGNPVPGAWMLRHVGFLGAMPPAVKGMAPLEFAESGMAVCFASPYMPTPSDCVLPQAPAGYTLGPAQEMLYHGAMQVQRALPHLSFAEAASYAEHILFDK